jgi:hypothetical protein
MRDGFNVIPSRELVDSRSIPGLPDKVLRDTPPPPSFEKPAQLRSRYTGEYDFLVQGQKNEWEPFKTHPDSRKMYSGPAFPEPTGGWTGNEWEDFRKCVFEHWKGPGYSPEELEYVAKQLWKAKVKVGTSYWIQYKVPPSTILETRPPDEQAEELRKRLLDVEVVSAKKEWVYRPPRFGESAGTPPQELVDPGNRPQGGTGHEDPQPGVRRDAEAGKRAGRNVSDSRRRRR